MGRLVTLINIRLLDDNGLERQQEHNVADYVTRLVFSTWQEMNTRVKINCSYGSILKHRTTGEVRYYHSSSNNASVFSLIVITVTTVFFSATTPVFTIINIKSDDMPALTTITSGGNLANSLNVNGNTSNF